jgi:hypothetical protein
MFCGLSPVYKIKGDVFIRYVGMTFMELELLALRLLGERTASLV